MSVDEIKSMSLSLNFFLSPVVIYITRSLTPQVIYSDPKTLLLSVEKFSWELSRESWITRIMFTSWRGKKLEMEQAKQVNKVKLITTDVGSFILFFWILKRNQEASAIGEMLNIPIYLWNIDTIVDYKFSLHFLVYMAKYLTTPSCCSLEKNPYMLGWVSNAMTQRIER